MSSHGPDQSLLRDTRGAAARSLARHDHADEVYLYRAHVDQGFEGGIGEIRHDGVGIALDSEGPRHRVLTEPFRLADRLMTNAEWTEFIEDGRYTKPLLWLSEGWAKALAEGWSRPLYWETRDGGAGRRC
jgi:Sulfatase-modifying factor enzyme 1